MDVVTIRKIFRASFVRYGRSQRRAISTKAFSCEIEREGKGTTIASTRQAAHKYIEANLDGSDSDKGERGRRLLTWEMGLRLGCFFIFVRKRNKFSLPPNKESGHMTRFLQTPRYYRDELLGEWCLEPHASGNLVVMKGFSGQNTSVLFCIMFYGVIEDENK